MTESVQSEIVRIAIKVRKQCQVYARDHHYNSELMGLCGIASCALSEELKKFGAQFVSGFCAGITHCWVVIDQFILDITATQFGFAEVIFGLQDELTQYEEICRMRSYDDFAGWFNKNAASPEKVSYVLSL